MNDAELARILRLADEPTASASFVDSLWDELSASWDGVDALDGEAEIAEHLTREQSSHRDGRPWYAGPAVAAAVLAGVVVVAGLLFSLAAGNRGADVAGVDVVQACEKFRSDAPGLRALQTGSVITPDELEKVVGALGVLAIDLESTGEVPFETVRSLRVAAGGLRQATTRLAEGDDAAAEVNIEFALIALDEVDAVPMLSSCFIFTVGQTP
ncbi:MAG: hypothetical protein KJP22_01490 [Acidimicrobiia bacterium]|nr:hypothetical protein [Acidimicrobiia bacterium]MBT8192049.1 hypothetical protein [Acidimicrobiia bacterium]MBT8247002.1 hypothetical protein [Acidimicrobiia bacterium]NNF88040.1 hypothetical protein [Acidimicrobiia bacterium]NNJ47686.1 hypothetical protein [Acidimicrobiia bacterium]